MISAETDDRSPLFSASFESNRTAKAGCSCASVRQSQAVRRIRVRPTVLLIRNIAQFADDLA